MILQDLRAWHLAEAAKWLAEAAERLARLIFADPIAAIMLANARFHLAAELLDLAIYGG